MYGNAAHWLKWLRSRLLWKLLNKQFILPLLHDPKFKKNHFSFVIYLLNTWNTYLDNYFVVYHLTSITCNNMTCFYSFFVTFCNIWLTTFFFNYTSPSRENLRIAYTVSCMGSLSIKKCHLKLYIVYVNRTNIAIAIFALFGLKKIASKIKW